jgi:hypothetical protein
MRVEYVRFERAFHYHCVLMSFSEQTTYSLAPVGKINSTKAGW